MPSFRNPAREESRLDKGCRKTPGDHEGIQVTVETKEKQSLLNAAEKLHARFEALIRVVRPPLKELDDFHVVLYMIYHHYMPQDSLEQVRVSVGQLQEKMAALNKVILPSRLKEKEEAFTAARDQLDKAVDELAAMLRSNDPGKIKAAVEMTHTSYQAVASIFD